MTIRCLVQFVAIIMLFLLLFSQNGTFLLYFFIYSKMIFWNFFIYENKYDSLALNLKIEIVNFILAER